MKPAKLFYTARFISFFGSAFTDFALPLYLYDKTNNPMHVGMQWAIIALTRIATVFISPHLKLPKISKHGLAVCDLLLFLSAFGLFIANDHWIVFAAYLLSLLNAAIVIIQNGYHDSLIGELVEGGADRTRLNGLIENGRYFGSTLGFICAFTIATTVGFRAAVLIDGITFLLSMTLILSIPSRSITPSPQIQKNGFPILLRTRQSQLLTLSQVFLNFAAFAFNASYVVAMKRDFGSDNFYLVTLQVAQMFAYSIGTAIASQRPISSKTGHVTTRAAIALLFCAFVFATHPIFFIAINTGISVLIGYSQPAILAFFQGFAEPSERRALGSARVAASAIAGSFGAAIASALMVNHGHQEVFMVAGTFAVMSSVVMFGYFSASTGLIQQR